MMRLAQTVYPASKLKVTVSEKYATVTLYLIDDPQEDIEIVIVMSPDPFDVKPAWEGLAACLRAMVACQETRLTGV